MNVLVMLAIAFALFGWLLNRNERRWPGWAIAILMMGGGIIFVWIFMLAWFLPRAMGYV